ncbi:MAG TPA: RtcB family protein, partial [Thermoplasmata archaeon]|nr:RtcB family protein [Thermoplasmata archaeon]
MPEWKGPVRQVDEFRYEIPRTYKPQMRTDGLLFVDGKMLPSVLADQAPEQVANVATMPGIVGKAMAMPDVHWGYGMPVGGVAAFDRDEGVISPGSIGSDINCLDKNSHVLTEHGYHRPIADFAADWRGMRLTSVNPQHRTVRTDISAFMRFRAEAAYRVRTATGVEITATADHPFLTPSGMIPLKDVGDQPVAVYPFRGVDYEAPPNDTLVSERDIAQLLAPGRVPQVLAHLRRRGLIPLTPRSPAFPYILKLMGLALGDGHASLRPKASGVVFYGRKEDLADAMKDVQRLGFGVNRIYSRNRRHSFEHSGKERTFDFEESSLRVGSTAFVALLRCLGLPVGNKAKQDFVLPPWLPRLPVWQKRLF